MTVTAGPNRIDDVMKAVSVLTKRRVYVGVPAEGADRSPEPGEPAGITNALIGYISEFGLPEKNIPARPHLVSGIESAVPRITERLRVTGQKALTGDLSEIDKGLHVVGILGQNAVRAKVTEGPFVPLAERTLADRRARGRTGEKPLLDTGQYRRSITYTVDDRGR